MAFFISCSMMVAGVVVALLIVSHFKKTAKTATQQVVAELQTELNTKCQTREQVVARFVEGLANGKHSFDEHVVLFQADHESIYKVPGERRGWNWVKGDLVKVYQSRSNHAVQNINRTAWNKQLAGVVAAVLFSLVLAAVSHALLSPSSARAAKPVVIKSTQSQSQSGERQ